MSGQHHASVALTPRKLSPVNWILEGSRDNMEKRKFSCSLPEFEPTFLIFLYVNPNKMHTSQSLFYLTTALHVSGITSTHLQEHKTTVTTASGNRYTVLLSAAIVEELEPV
jgi:hypothetical protein